MKKNIESSPQEIWIRIHFLEINGSPSLVFSFIKDEMYKLNIFLKVGHDNYVQNIT